RSTSAAGASTPSGSRRRSARSSPTASITCWSRTDRPRWATGTRRSPPRPPHRRGITGADRLGADLGEVDHGDRVVLGHVAVVELPEEVGELVDVADLGV